MCLPQRPFELRKRTVAYAHAIRRSKGGTISATPGAGDQFYVTHCTTADSVLNNPGYTVRAASATDPDALDAAFRYPPYELPIDMWRDLPRPAAPRRLARTEHPDGGVWVVHSAYLAKDTVDRDRSYFSHLFLLNSADPATVLRRWGSDGWVKSYPQGAPKSLPATPAPGRHARQRRSRSPRSSATRPPGPADLPSPSARPLRAAAVQRRDLSPASSRRLLLLAPKRTTSRRRLFIHAEPGVVALLLYGAVRLLPPHVTDDLTFSTFEPYHRNIRDYKLAEVVGTYLGAGQGARHRPRHRSRHRAGHVRPRAVVARTSQAGAEILLPAGVSDLIDLAARGEWGLLPTVRAACHRRGRRGAVAGQPATAPRRRAGPRGRRRGRHRRAARAPGGPAGGGGTEGTGREGVAGREGRRARPCCADVRTAFRELLAEPDHVQGSVGRGGRGDSEGGLSAPGTRGGRSCARCPLGRSQEAARTSSWPARRTRTGSRGSRPTSCARTRPPRAATSGCSAAAAFSCRSVWANWNRSCFAAGLGRVHRVRADGEGRTEPAWSHPGQRTARSIGPQPASTCSLPRCCAAPPTSMRRAGHPDTVPSFLATPFTPFSPGRCKPWTSC